MQFQKKQKPKNTFPIICSVLTVAAAHIVFMLFSGKTLLSSNPYNSYIRQAMAWCNGTLYLPENYPWLELAIYDGHYFVSFPPFPSYLLFPFAIILGDSTPDSLLAFCVMLVGVVYAVRIAKQCGLDDRTSVLLSTFLYCANNVWMVTVDAWVWFFAQNLSLTLTLMAFYYGSVDKFGRSLLCLAAAVGCRPFQILYLPLILYWLIKSELNSWTNFKQLFLRRIYRFIPALLLGISYMVLNVLRFDNPFEFGHNYLPEFLRAEQGQFSLSYLLENIHRLFELPVFDPITKKLVFQGFNGTNIFIVFPILFVFLFILIERICSDVKHKSVCEIPGSVSIGLAVNLSIIHVLLLCAHRTMGGAHFGNRYIIDTLPAIYWVLIKLCATPPETVVCKYTHIAKMREIVLSVCYISGLLINFVGVLNFYNQ